MAKSEMTVDKWALFVSQLIERTQDNRVQWSSYVPKQTDGPAKIDTVYQTKFKDKTLRLFQIKPREQESHAASWFARPSVREEIILKIVDDQQNEVWRFPESRALGDLLSAVKYQVAKIDDFLKEILEQ